MSDRLPTALRGPRSALRSGPAGASAAAPSRAPRALPAGLVRSLQRAHHLPQRLREALALACDERQPIRTVERLAAMAGCDRRTLWAHWKQSAGRHTPLRLQDFLHWLLLLRAVHRKTLERPWAQVAEEIGVHPHTLSRLTRQLTGNSLRELAAHGHEPLSQRFHNEVLAPVVTPPPRG
jgi:hypothetical protein